MLLSLHPCLYQRGSQFGSVYPRVTPSWWEPLAPGFTDEVLGHQQGRSPLQGWRRAQSLAGAVLSAAHLPFKGKEEALITLR